MTASRCRGGAERTTPITADSACRSQSRTPDRYWAPQILPIQPEVDAVVHGGPLSKLVGRRSSGRGARREDRDRAVDQPHVRTGTGRAKGCRRPLLHGRQSHRRGRTTAGSARQHADSSAGGQNDDHVRRSARGGRPQAAWRMPISLGPAAAHITRRDAIPVPSRTGSGPDLTRVPRWAEQRPPANPRAHAPRGRIRRRSRQPRSSANSDPLRGVDRPTSRMADSSSSSSQAHSWWRTVGVATR